MKKYVTAGWILMLILLLQAGWALAETGRVVTPKGPANMRRNPEGKAPLVESVPNRTLVEIEELGEEWSRITYKKRSGYVKTEFLRAPSQLTGRQVYPDGGTVLIYAAAEENAKVMGVLGCAEQVTVLSAEGDWLRIQRNGEEGYAQSIGFSYQLTEPAGELEWITQTAEADTDAEMRTEPGGKGEAAGNIRAGQACLVTALEGKYCLVVTKDGCGWAPQSALRLTGNGDAWEETEGMTPNEASRVAQEKLTKKYKSFAQDRLYNACAVYAEKDGYPGPLYHVTYYNDQNQYLYGALISAATGEAVFLARYEGFAAPKPAEEALLPEGETALTLSARELAVGEVLEIQAAAWTKNAVRYDLYADGQQLIKGKDVDHFTAAFRPRQAGEYEIEVTVTDEAGRSEKKRESFTVDSEYVVSEDEGTEGGLYSQKDGWWKSKRYRHSTLEKSGCAIFALSHGLHILGFAGPETEPENLAVKYAQFLIPEEGTSNERLINKAAQDFGFKSRTALYTDPKQIIALFESGAVFSFSPARGHIALADGVSEDGAMVHIRDSAPGATFERIKGESLYYRMRSGAFRAALTLEDLPGALWYPETEEYGALEYWLPIEYIAKRGVRLMQPLSAEEGGK